MFQYAYFIEFEHNDDLPTSLPTGQAHEMLSHLKITLFQPCHLKTSKHQVCDNSNKTQNYESNL